LPQHLPDPTDLGQRGTTPRAAAATVHFNAVEVPGWLWVEQVLTYPHPSVKLLNGVTPAVAT